jgi:AraC-like DNA-binding protein
MAMARAFCLHERYRRRTGAVLTARAISLTLDAPVRPRPTISLAAATGLIDAIKSAEGDPDQVLHSVGLDRAALSRPDGFIACADFARLLEEAARATGDECFGLHFGEQYQPKNIGPLVYVVLNSPTIAVALDNVVRFLKVHNQAAEVTVAVEGPRLHLRESLIGVPVEGARQQVEYGLAVTLNTIRMMVGSRWVPMEVQLAHRAPRDTSEHARVFGAPVSFDCPATAFVLDRDFVERQVPAADEHLYPILRRYLEQIAQELPREDAALASARRAVGELVRDGDPKLTEVARRLAMSPRTLQRRLREHGLDFRGLVDDTRRRFSLGYLRDPQHTPTEIAYLLGYSEVSAFNRAFKRWTGSTPVGYRRGAS